jgi:hypothetical protein
MKFRPKNTTSMITKNMKGSEYVDDSHHEQVDAPAEVARSRTVENADDDRHDGGEQADGERDPARDQRAGQEVATVGVGAEEEVPALDRDIGHEAPALVSSLDHRCGSEQVGPFEIGEEALVDRTRSREGDPHRVPGDADLGGTGADPGADALDGRPDLVVRRIGLQARRDAHIVGINGVVAMPRQVRSEQTGERDEPEHDGPDHGSLVAEKSCPGIRPQRATRHDRHGE